MNLLISQHNPRLCRILDRKLCLSILPGDPPNRSRKMLSIERLDILDLERLNEQVIEPQQRDGIIHIKAQRERLDEIRAFLERRGIEGAFARAQLDGAVARVHAHLQEEVFDERGVDSRPGGFERGHPVRGDGDFAGFVLGEGGLACVLARWGGGEVGGMGEGAYGGACGCEDGAAFFVDRHHVGGGGGFGDGGGEGEGGVD